jgi:hypothetical protein
VFFADNLSRQVRAVLRSLNARSASFTLLNTHFPLVNPNNQYNNAEGDTKQTLEKMIQRGPIYIRGSDWDNFAADLREQSGLQVFLTCNLRNAGTYGHFLLETVHYFCVPVLLTRLDFGLLEVIGTTLPSQPSIMVPFQQEDLAKPNKRRKVVAPAQAGHVGGARLPVAAQAGGDFDTVRIFIRAICFVPRP